MGSSKKGNINRNDRAIPFDVSSARLNKMSLSDLEKEMEFAIDAMTEETYDPAVIDAYLEAMDYKSPIPTPLDPKAAYSLLQRKLKQEFKDQEQTFTSKKFFGRKRNVLRIGLVAVIAAVCLLGGMVVAQASGVDVFGGLANWTADTFSFGNVSSKEPEETSNGTTNRNEDGEFVEKLPSEYQELWVELKSRGVYTFFYPTNLPEGFQVDDSDLSIFPESDTVDYVVWYTNGNDEIAFRILLSSGQHGTYEKDDRDVEIYTICGIDHYIFSNNGENVAVWYLNNLEYSMSTNISISELKATLDSMY